MKREDEYRQLANDVLRRASEEQSAQMRAQWEILGARNNTPERETSDDLISWDHRTSDGLRKRSRV